MNLFKLMKIRWGLLESAKREKNQCVSKRKRKSEQQKVKRASKNERKEKGKSIQKGEKNKRENLFAKKSEVKSVMVARLQLFVLTYKDIYFSTNDLNHFCLVFVLLWYRNLMITLYRKYPIDWHQLELNNIFLTLAIHGSENWFLNLEIEIRYICEGDDSRANHFREEKEWWGLESELKRSFTCTN